MSICNIPNAITTIDLDECVGTSLATINTNFLRLQQQACEDNAEIFRLTQDLLELSSSYLELSSKASGIPKAWIVFNGNSGPNPIIYSSYNVAQVSSIGVGKYTITFGTPFANLNYALVGSSSWTPANPPLDPYYTWLQPTTAFTPASATINIHDLSGTFVNPEYITISIYSK
jgi:hypothetical protein